MSGFDIRAAARALDGEAHGSYVLAPGPGHSRADRSLKVTPDPAAPDGFVVHSFCGDAFTTCRDHVAERLGKPAWKPNSHANGVKAKAKPRRVATFVYTDADSAPYLRVDRLEPKSFRQFRWVAEGEGGRWEPGKPKGPKVPYRLPELRAAAPNEPVFVVEGEGKADALAALGFVATSTSEGAATGSGGAKWPPDLNQWFEGRTVYVLPDNDGPGAAHAQAVATNLHGVAAEVRIVNLPNLKPGEDVKEWLQGGGDADQLMELCRRAPVYHPQPDDHGPEGDTQHRLAEATAAAEPIFDPWDNYTVPKFPLDILPASSRLFVIEQAEVVGCDPSALAMATLANASGSLDHRFGLKLMRHGDWIVSPRLWILGGRSEPKENPRHQRGPSVARTPRKQRAQGACESSRRA